MGSRIDGKRLAQLLSPFRGVQRTNFQGNTYRVLFAGCLQALQADGKGGGNGNRGCVGTISRQNFTHSC